MTTADGRGGPGSNQHVRKPPQAPRDMAGETDVPTGTVVNDPLGDPYEDYDHGFPAPLPAVHGTTDVDVSDLIVDHDGVERADRVVHGAHIDDPALSRYGHGTNLWPTDDPNVVVLGTFAEAEPVSGGPPDAYVPVDLAKVDAQGHDRAGTAARLDRVFREEWASQLKSLPPDRHDELDPHGAAKQAARRIAADPTAGCDVDEATGEAAECGWGVRTGYHPDDGTDIVEDCCAPTVSHDRGWSCGRGHAHESGAQYFDDDEIAAGHHHYADNPRDMQGRSFF